MAKEHLFKPILLIVILLLGITSEKSLAQQISLCKRPSNIDPIDARYQIKSVLDEGSSRLYIICYDSLVTINLKDFTLIEKKRLKISSNPQDKLDLLTPLLIKGLLYFVHNEGAMVYKMVNDSLVKLGNTYNHKMQCESSIFVSNDTIFRYGGYGFWTCRDFFTYYVFGINEWEILQPLKKLKSPPGSFHTSISFENQKWYLYKGFYFTPNEYLKSTVLNQCWSFDPSMKRWKRLGKLRKVFPQNSIIITSNNETYIIDDSNTYKLNFSNNQNLIFEKTAWAKSVITYSI